MITDIAILVNGNVKFNHEEKCGAYETVGGVFWSRTITEEQKNFNYK